MGEKKKTQIKVRRERLLLKEPFVFPKKKKDDTDV